MKTYGTLLLLTVAWGVLSFGAVYPWAYWPLATACAALGIAGLRGSAQLSGRSAGDRFSAAPWLGMFALGAGVQLVPLPRSALLAASGSTDAFFREHTFGYALDPPAWLPLSIAPGSTWIGLGLFVAFGLFLLGASRALSAVDLESLTRRLMLFAVLIGLFGIVQKAFHGEEVRDALIYGFWQPQRAGNPFGPFVNRNHFAGWMIMVLPLALGYAFGLLERMWPRWRGWREALRWMAATNTGPLALATLSILAMGTALVLTGSRSGIAGVTGAIAVAAIFVLRAVTRRSRRRFVVAYAGALLVTAVAWAGVDATVQRFAAVPGDLEGRLTAWRDTARIVRDFPVFGTGLNTYGAAMLVYQTASRPVFYQEAHNDYLQLVAEGGLLLSLPATIALGLFARDVRRRFRKRADDPMTYWIRVGAVASLAGIAAQSLVDFSLQMPGNAALFTLVAAIAVHRPAGRSRASRL